jgi:hypothetical protein
MSKTDKRPSRLSAKPTRWENRITGYGQESPDQLLANARNPRRHDRHQQAVMQALLEEVGFVQDVIVNARTGNLVDGHMRVQLALRAGIDTIPVKYVDLAPDEELTAVATLDAITGMAETDEDAFQTLLDSIATDEDTLAGFLDTLSRSGGRVPTDTAAGDDLSPGRILSKFSWGGHSTLMSAEEKEAIITRLDDYIATNETTAGFVASLVEGKDW